MPSEPTPVPQPPTSYITELVNTFEGHEKCISAVAALPDGLRIVTSSKDATLCLWELSTKKVLKHLIGHSSDVFQLAVSRDGKFIASCDATGGIIPWDGETGDCLINAHSGPGFTETQIAQNGSNTTTDQSLAVKFITAYKSTAVVSLDFSIDGNILACAGDKTVKFWGTTTWQEEKKKAFTLEAIASCVRYSPSGEHLAIATEKAIGIYNAGTMDCIRLLQGHLGGTFALTWTLKESGTYLLSGGGKGDATIRVWDASGWTEFCAALQGHTERINAISVNESSTIITSASTDSTIRLWPFPIQSTVLKVSASAFCVTFSKDCRYIFGGGNDLKISQWRLSSTLTQGEQNTGVVETKMEIFNMSETARKACTTGDFSTAVKIFTQEIKEDSSNYVCYGHRAIALARERNWDAALEDANQSISIKRSSVGFMSKGIALCGKGQILEAHSAFNSALRMATGDSKTHHRISLMRAVAIFNANKQEEAIKDIKEIVECSDGADLLTCNVVLTYLYAQMGFASWNGKTLDKADDIVTAKNIAETWLFHDTDFVEYEEFIMAFGWDFQSLRKNINMYYCIVLLLKGRVKAFVYFISLLEECSSETEKDDLISWFKDADSSDGSISLVPMGQSARGTNARETTEDETQKATDQERSANGHQSQTDTCPKTETGEESQSDASEDDIIPGCPETMDTGPSSNQPATARGGTEANSEGETKVVRIADGKMLEKIKKVLDRLADGRTCSQEDIWVQTSIGFRCMESGYSISWEELKNVDASVN